MLLRGLCLLGLSALRAVSCKALLLEITPWQTLQIRSLDSDPASESVPPSPESPHEQRPALVDENGLELAPNDPRQCVPPDDIHHGTFCAQRGKQRLGRGFYVSCSRRVGMYRYTINYGGGVKTQRTCPKKSHCHAIESTVPGTRSRIWIPGSQSPKPAIICVAHGPRGARRPFSRSHAPRPPPPPGPGGSSSTASDEPRAKRIRADPTADVQESASGEPSNALVWHDDIDFGHYFSQGGSAWFDP